MTNLSAQSKICILGAGTMGTGIAAHFCNLGFHVALLDVTVEAAEKGLARALQARPSHFYEPQRASLIQVGSIQEHPHHIQQADWVCEAIIEKMDAKQALYEQIEPHLKPDALITTNTSGLEISLLASSRSHEFRKRFMGTHFFNPPRYLKLIELVPTPETDPLYLQAIKQFLETHGGRRVVLAKDTPGFIANRYGIGSLFLAIHVAEKVGLSPEEVDVLTGPFLGRPKTGTFRLCDIIGLDILRDIVCNIYNRCEEDPYRENLRFPRSFKALLERGALGNKVGQGYYSKQNGKLHTFDLRTLEYREKSEPIPPDLPDLMKLPLGERIREALKIEDSVGVFLHEYLVPTLQYAAWVAPEISHNVLDFDRIMKWGFSWEMGPFELIDAIGASELKIKENHFYIDNKVKDSAGNYIPLPSESEYKQPQDYKLLQTEKNFNIRDFEEGILGICLTTKMGVLNADLISKLHALLQDTSQPIILCSEARAFSAGVDLNSFLLLAKEAKWDQIDQLLEELQKLADLLSQKKAVAAIHGYCLGGGFEIACACPLIVAHPEAQLGLPESKVGLLPAGGGSARMRQQAQSNPEKLLKVLKALTLGTISSCAEDAKLQGYLRPTDIIINHPDRLITEAKRYVFQVQFPGPPTWQKLPGIGDEAFSDLLKKLEATHKITLYDKLIASYLRKIFFDPTSFEEALAKEREFFVNLLKNPETIVRIQHMLETGKPLKN
jgi:3-hydroxyacyl-CoA dehydrogenase